MSNEDTMTVEGNPGKGDSGIHWGGGGNGGGNDRGGSKGSSQPNLSDFPEAQAAGAFGAPLVLGLSYDMWGLTLFNQAALQKGITSVLDKLGKGVALALPYGGRVLGGVVASLIPSQIARDNPAMMATAHIFSVLPVDKVTSTPVSALPVQQATVVHTRITDIVLEDGRQHLAVVRNKDLAVSVPVIEAKPTKRSGVYTASVVPGKPDLHIKVVAGSAPTVSQSGGVVSEEGGVGFPGFTAGSRTHDAIVRFPGDKSSPVYVTVTEVLREAEVLKQLEEERRQQEEWDALHPAEVAENAWLIAKAAFESAYVTWKSLKTTFDDLQASPEGQALSDPAKYPIKSTSKHKIRVTEYMFRGVIDVTTEANIDSRAKLDYLLAHDGLAYKRNILKDTKEVQSDDIEGDKAIYKAEYQEYDKLRQRLLDVRNKIISTEKALALALESLEQKEKKKDETEETSKKENKRKEPGVAKGEGKKVTEKWLEDASKETGAPIPEEVAAKLKGKTFSSFDAFRKALWEEISRHPQLLNDLKKSNKTNVAKGKSPFVKKSERAGGRLRHELHHKDPISKGGEVYDMDNLSIMTPRRHINTHKGGSK